MQTKTSQIFLVGLAMMGFGTAAHAAWPQDRPIEIVIPYEAGGENDVVTRALVNHMVKHFPGANFYVTNKPGASGEIGTAYVQRAKPDGYVFGMASVPPLVFVPLTKKTAYDLSKIRLVARTMHDPSVLVAHSGSSLVSLSAIVQKSKAGQPLSISNVGLGSHAHLAAVLMEKSLNIDLTNVPYNGTGAAKIALMGKQIDLMMTSQSAVTTDTTGTLKPILQFTSERAPALPQVPTAKEQGVNVEMDVDRGFIAPAGVPPEILGRFEAAVEATVKDPVFLKSIPTFAPVMSFASGAQWQAIADKRMPSLREIARTMPKD